MYRDEKYPEWAKAEKMEMSTPLCELWSYSEETQKFRCKEGIPDRAVPVFRKSVFVRSRAGMLRKKVAQMLYRLADCIYAEDSGKKNRMEYL